MRFQITVLFLLTIFLVAVSHSVQAAPPNGSAKRAITPAKGRTFLPTAISSDNYVADMDYAEYWQRERMPLKVFIHPCEGVFNFDPEFVTVFRFACDDWTKATDNKIRFIFTEKLDEADITVRWTSDISSWPSSPTGEELGISNVGIKRAGLISSDIYILTTVTHLKQQTSVKAMKKICLHELGHTFGLGHSSKESDVMYPTQLLTPRIVDGKTKMELPDGDEPGAGELSSRDATTMKVVYAAKIKLDEIRAKDLDKESACAELINESVRQNSIGDYAQAIIYLNEALKIDPASRVAMSNLMASYYNCGISKYNVQAYKQALIPIAKAIALSKKCGSVPQLKEMESVQQNCQRIAKVRGDS